MRMSALGEDLYSPRALIRAAFAGFHLSELI